MLQSRTKAQMTNKNLIVSKKLNNHQNFSSLNSQFDITRHAQQEELLISFKTIVTQLEVLRVFVQD